MSHRDKARSRQAPTSRPDTPTHTTERPGSDLLGAGTPQRAILRSCHGAASLDHHDVPPDAMVRPNAFPFRAICSLVAALSLRDTLAKAMH
jgi:hypothetical protein